MKLLPSDTPAEKTRKNLELFSHLCRRRAREETEGRYTFRWDAERIHDLAIGPRQREVIAPTPKDLAIGRILRDVSAGDGSLRMAQRKLNTCGEVSSQCAWLNSPARMEKIKQHLELAATLERMKMAKAAEKKTLTEAKIEAYQARSPAAVRSLAGLQFTAAVVKSKLTIADMYGVMIVELRMSASDLPKGSKAKVIAAFMDAANRSGWAPPASTATARSDDPPSSEDEILHSSSDAVVGRKVRKEFWDSDAEEFELFDGKVVSKFGSGGGALYHILYQDGDEEDLMHEEVLDILL